MTSPESSSVIYVQIRPQSSAVSPQSALDDFTKASQEKLKDIAKLIANSLQGLVNEINSASVPPAEITLEFGVDVGAEGGIPFITKGSIGANFKVSVLWRKGTA